jgi:hypothetical protein
VQPAIEINAAGEFAIVWVAQFDDQPLGTHVMMQRYSAGGAPLGAATPVTAALSGPEGDKKYNPDIAAAANSWVVTWGVRNTQTDANSLLARLFEIDGAPRTGEILIESDLSGQFDIFEEAPLFLDAAADGRFIVTWAEWYFFEGFPIEDTGRQLGGESECADERRRRVPDHMARR